MQSSLTATATGISTTPLGPSGGGKAKITSMMNEDSY